MMGGKTKKEQKEQKGQKYESIQKDLEQQRTSLLAEAGEILGGGLNAEKENFPDLGDQASAEANQNFTLRLRGREQKLLKKIDEALDRINNGSFGICESCGEEISIKRVKARPVTTLCIDCKTMQEEEEKNRQ